MSATRPYSLASARIVKVGRDNTDPRPMSDWQAERMGAGFPDARRTAGSLFPRFAILLGTLTLAWMIWRFFA